MKPQPVEPSTPCRLAISVRGIVQGVGFRPFVYNAARARDWPAGCRTSPGRCGSRSKATSAALDEFFEALRHDHPPQARIDALEVQEIACRSMPERDAPADGFQIRTAWQWPRRGRPSRPTWPPAACAWPKFTTRPNAATAIRSPTAPTAGRGGRSFAQLPYDRPRTSMADFAMCPECAAGIRRSGRPAVPRPADRLSAVRPGVELLDAEGAGWTSGPAALDMAVEALLEGRILALKGLGGFQLLVDADQCRGRRPAARAEAAARPAVCRDVPFAGRGAAALRSLRRRGPRAGFARGADPAVAAAPCEGTIADSRNAKSGIVESVAPGQSVLGVMLPYTPLHHLLMEAVGRPIVCTSGNLSEEPMAIATETPCAAGQRRCDDGAWSARHCRPAADPRSADRPPGRRFRGAVRRRGLAGASPRAGICPAADRAGHRRPDDPGRGRALKNTVALGLGSRPMQVVLSPHVGDLDSLLSVEVFRRAIDDLVDFFGSRRRWSPATCIPTTPPRGMPRSWPRDGACRCGGCSITTPTWPPAWPSTAWRARCWGWPGTAPATAPTARSGAARRWCARGRACPRRPSADLPLARRRSGRCASRGVRPWACCTKSWAAGSRRAPAGRRRRRLVHARRIGDAAGGAGALGQLRPGPAAWGGCSTAWRRCAGCRGSSASRGKRPWRWSSPPTGTRTRPIPCRWARARPPWPIGSRWCGRCWPTGPPACRSAHQRPFPQRPGRAGRGRGPAGGGRGRWSSAAAAFKTPCLATASADGCRRPAFQCTLIGGSRPATAASPWAKSSSPPQLQPRIIACVWAFPGKCWKSTSRTTCPWARSSSAASSRRFAWPIRPRPQVGDYVIVHVGFAISRVDEAEAEEIFTYLEEIAEGEQWKVPFGTRVRDRETASRGSHYLSRREARAARRMKYSTNIAMPRGPGGWPRPSPGATTRPWNLMEVCGGQTHAIVRFGLDEMLPPADHADPRPRLPGVRHAAGNDRQGGGHRRRGRR